MEAIYFRYGEVLKEKFDRLQKAIDFLSIVEDGGEGYSLGIYDNTSNIAYVLDGMADEKVCAFSKIGITPDEIKIIMPIKSK